MLSGPRIMTPPPEEITAWLARWREGDQHARDQVFDLVHGRLREIASRLLQPARGDHTLEPSALVNELCMRLIGNQTIHYDDRAHFFAVAAQTMRRILIDHARAGLAEKRGGEQQRISLSGVDGIAPVSLNEEILDLDEALSKLATLDPRAAQVVELRFFGGFEESQVAEVLGVSAINVKRDWKAARAWLAGQLSPASRTPRF
jgi:RNA polymerase sigma-70 factor (ECF subfamily)